MVLAPNTANSVFMSVVKKVAAVAILTLVVCIQCKKKNSSNPTDPVIPGSVAIKDSVIITGLNYPWEILWGPDNFIWMTERGGKISRVNPATGVVTLLHTINEVISNGEGGLLGMVLHPNFSTTPNVFVAYNYNNGAVYREKIVRFTYNGTTLTNPVIILDNIAASSIHNGCRLVITPDLKLFITTGDASTQALPQNTSSLNGKVMRLNLDGTIPTDNPVAGNPYWSFGHRNPQGLVYAKIFYTAANMDQVMMMK